MVTEKAKSNWDYEVEDGARTLIKAQQIKVNKKLYTAVLKELQKQRMAVNKAIGGKE